MPALRLRASVTGDLLRLALVAGHGRLRRTGILAIAARTALLVDLAAVGWVVAPGPGQGLALDGAGPGQQALTVDLIPTGCGPADELIAHATKAGRPVERALRLGRPHLSALTRALVAEGCWRPRGTAAGVLGYRDVAGDAFRALRARGPDVLAGRVAARDDRELVAVAFADVLGLCGLRDVHAPVDRRSLDRTAVVGWLAGDAVEFVRQMRLRRDVPAEGAGDG